MSAVKGSILRARVRWVEAHHGPGGIARLRERAPELSAILDHKVIKAAWYPFDLMVQLVEAIDHTFGSGDLALAHTMGRYAADVNLPTLYRLFYRVNSTRYILERAERLYALHYDCGSLVTVERGAQSWAIEIRDFPTPHVIHCRSLLGWAERSLELSGARMVLASEVSCRAAGDDACLLRFRWR